MFADSLGVGLAKKGFRDGTHRTVSPEETVARVLKYAGDFGLTRVANITGLDIIGIPVYVAHRPNSRSLAVSQGKGLTPAAAKASAVMESVETFHAERISAPLKFASARELAVAHHLVNVQRLNRAAASSWTADTRIFWTEGRDLNSGESAWVPFELVHLNYTLPTLTGSGFFIGSSNGLASGNHFLEAVAHGICEAIERDAATLWTLSGEAARRASRLDLDSVDAADCREVLSAFERAGVAVAVWETTSDVGVASFLCKIIDSKPNPLRPLPAARGMGCHLSRDIALLRALTEAAQSRLTGIAGSRDDIGEILLRHLLSAEGQAHASSEICGIAGSRRFHSVPTASTDSFEEDVALLSSRLKSAGMGNVVVVDLTDARYRIPVVRVIVPGLEALFDMPLFEAGERAMRVVERRS